MIGLISIALPTFMKKANRNNINSILILVRFSKVFGFSNILRTISFLSTSLPSPSHHCRLESTTYNPPKNLSDIIFRMDPFSGCGDLIYSGHTSTVLCGAITVSHYCYYLLPNYWKYIVYGFWLPIVIMMAYVIISAQNHYTVDIIVAWYTIPLLYYFIWNMFPDPKEIRYEVENEVEDEDEDKDEEDVITL